jgi:hypothetical protein
MTLITIPRLLDVLAIGAALLSAWLWYKAGMCRTRRITLGETLDARDFNRIVTALNRSSILNRRAALATAVSAIIVALKLMHDLSLTFVGH